MVSDEIRQWLLTPKAGRPSRCGSLVPPHNVQIREEPLTYLFAIATDKSLKSNRTTVESVHLFPNRYVQRINQNNAFYTNYTFPVRQRIAGSPTPTSNNFLH